jgi:hypothetical protein
MSEIEARVHGLRPAEPGQRRPLPEALREALDRILLKRRLRDGEPPHDGDVPPGAPSGSRSAA